MKICITSDGYPSEGLPYSSFIQVLARELTRQGCEVTVIAPQSLTNHFIRGGKMAPKKFCDEFYVNGILKKITIYRPYSITCGEGVLGKLTFQINRLATEFAVFKNRLNLISTIHIFGQMGLILNEQPERQIFPCLSLRVRTKSIFADFCRKRKYKY